MEGKVKFCKHCGGKIAEDAVVCVSCGRQVEKMDSNNIVINNVIGQKGPFSKWTAFLLCFFLGYLGAHKFYEGKIGLGILYLFTLGLFGIGVLIDWIIILTKPDPYYL